MPKLTIEFNCDNESFHSEDDGSFSPATEIGAILRTIAHRISNTDDGEHLGLSGTIRDSNGNRIGFWEIEEEK